MESKIYFLLGESELFYTRYKSLFPVFELKVHGIKPICLFNEDMNLSLKKDLEEENLNEEIEIFYAKTLRKPLKTSDINKYMESAKNVISHIKEPNTGIELWKLILLDDWAGSFSKSYYELPDFEKVKAVVSTIYNTNNTDGFTSYYQYQLFTVCKEKNIPMIGVEFQTLLPQYYYHYHFYDYFILKNEKSKELLIEKVGVPEDRIFLLKSKYKSIFSNSISSPKAILKTFDDIKSYEEDIFSGKPIITILHNISERLSFRFALRALSHIKEKFMPIVISNPKNAVLFMKENEVVTQSYIDEISKLPNQGFLLMETQRDIYEFLSLYSDIIIYVEPSEIFDLPAEKYNNVIIFNKFLDENYTNKVKIFNDENKLTKYINSYLSKQKHKKTFKEIISQITQIGDK